jgi:nitroreductase
MAENPVGPDPSVNQEASEPQKLLSRNHTLQSILERHSTRNFSSRPVSDEDIRTILQAANQAPSAHNEQSWRFIVLSGERKQSLASLVSSRAVRFPKAPSALLRMAARSIAGAPVVIAIANTGELIARGPELFSVDPDAGHDFFRVMEIQSSAAAAENLLVATTSLGLAAVWLGVLVLIKDEVLQFLEEPKGEFMAVIPVGYAAQSSSGPRKRQLDSIVKTLS